MDMLGAHQLQPIANRALFLDMNSFFASVEQQVDPRLRGRPVAVCPFVHDSTCVLAASIEAKRHGIKTGTSLREAKERCPDITLLTVNAPLYRDYHRRVMKMLNDTRCRVIVKSIDEAMMVVPRDLRASTLALADDIRHQVREIGDWLSCSIGIAPNLFLAKLATNAMKPNGLVQVLPEEIEGFYGTLALTDLYGVSWRLSKRFRRLGWTTPLELYQAPLHQLRRHLGDNTGTSWYLRLRGIEVDLKPTNRSSIGHQMTLTPNAATRFEEVWDAASQLVAKVSHRLRFDGYTSHRLVCFVRYSNRTHWGKMITHTQYTNDLPTLLAAAKQAFRELPFYNPVRLVGVSAINLKPVAATSYSLFPEDRKPERLTQAIDLITDKFGRGTISTARTLHAPPVADHIGFGNAPDVAQLAY